MSKLNILIAFPSSKLGGAEQVLLQISQFYCDSNINLFFFKVNNDTDLNNFPSNSKFIFSKYGNNFFNGLFFFIYYHIKNRQRYDFIYSSHVHVNSCLGILRKFKLIRVKYLVCRESTDVFKRYSGVKKFIYNIVYWIGYKYIDLLILQTLEMLDNFKSNLSNNIIDSKKILVINNPTSFKIKKVNLEIVEVLSKPYFVAAGRFIYEKGFDVLIDSFDMFVKIHPNYKLYILGEGKLFNQIRVKIQMLNLGSSIFLVGFTSDVYTYFKYASTCVISSRIEGFPNVLLQMMSVNSNVVSTICTTKINDVPGIIKCKPNCSYSLLDSLLESIKYQNTDNLLLFNNYLKENTVEHFITKIISKLEK